MGFFPLLWLFPVLAYGQAQGTYTLSARLEATGRSPYEGMDSPGARHVLDVELFPLAETEVFGGAWHFSGVYAPMLRLREVYAEPQSTEGNRFEHYHRLAWFAERRREGRARPYVRQTFSYGKMDLLAALAGSPALPGVPPGPPPALSQSVAALSLKDVQLETEAGIDIPLSRYWAALIFVGYAWGGGVDKDSRAYLPMARTPFFGLQTEWQMTSTDTLILRLAGRYGFFLSNRAEAGTVDLYETWRHRFDERTTVELSAGVSAYGGRPAPGQIPDPNNSTPNNTILGPKLPFRWHAAPYVALRLLRHFEWETHNLDMDLLGQIAPFLDRYTASAYERAEASVGLRWRWEDIYAEGRGGLGRGLGLVAEELAMTTYFGEAAVGYRFNPYCRMELRGNYASLPQFVQTEAAAAPVLTRADQWRIGLSLTIEYSGSY
ncbi:MAG: hypothetical protein FWC28_07600 [Proteobacteria bacterium]|nr:hypothetical protein [Cystobacterineae bacterium]MCL2258392.1 hypothetical protein [Cystobacterineae bacterium]MCL2315096.1 hypothetical protein [Pseudomonadota bacterium]